MAAVLADKRRSDASDEGSAVICGKALEVGRAISARRSSDERLGDTTLIVSQ